MKHGHFEIVRMSFLQQLQLIVVDCQKYRMSALSCNSSEDIQLCCIALYLHQFADSLHVQQLTVVLEELTESHFWITCPVMSERHFDNVTGLVSSIFILGRATLKVYCDSVILHYRSMKLRLQIFFSGINLYVHNFAFPLWHKPRYTVIKPVLHCITLHEIVILLVLDFFLIVVVRCRKYCIAEVSCYLLARISLSTVSCSRLSAN